MLFSFLKIGTTTSSTQAQKWSKINKKKISLSIYMIIIPLMNSSFVLWLRNISLFLRVKKQIKKTYQTYRKKIKFKTTRNVWIFWDNKLNFVLRIKTRPEYKDNPCNACSGGIFILMPNTKENNSLY